MSVRLRALALLSLSAVVLLPALVLAAGVEPLFDLSAPTTGPFPSDRFTALDLHNNTLLRVDLPKPDCAVRVTDCQDIDVINTLDGFNLQPRLSIPFSDPIDPASVSSDTVFLVNLFLPSGTPPADGWPVAIFGHGFTDSKHGAPWPSARASPPTASPRSPSTSSATAAGRSAP